MSLVPLRVRARLAAGIAHASPWGIALDGLLAAQLWAAQRTTLRAQPDYTRPADQPVPPDLNLPLARCTPPDGPWHWAATCAYPDPPPSRVDVHTWTGRADHRALEQLATRLPAHLPARQGRYRARRMPLLVTPCPAVTWHAVGDLDAVTELVSDIVSIGKKRSSGEGHVLGWEVSPAPDLDPLTAAHLHPDGSLGRPTPPACLARFDRLVPDGGTGRAGIRPPYMHPARQHQLHLPALLP